MEESGKFFKRNPTNVTQRQNKSVSTWPLCYRQFEEGYKDDYVIVYSFTNTWHGCKGKILISHSIYDSAVSVKMN
jgi:hypothetical protein